MLVRLRGDGILKHVLVLILQISISYPTAPRSWAYTPRIFSYGASGGQAVASTAAGSRKQTQCPSLGPQEAQGGDARLEASGRGWIRFAHSHMDGS